MLRSSYHPSEPCQAWNFLQGLQAECLYGNPVLSFLLHSFSMVLSATPQHPPHDPPMQVVQREYDELFGGEVEAVHVVQDMADLNKLCKEYEKLKGKLADLIDDYTSKKRRHKKIKPQKVGEAPVVPQSCDLLITVCTSHALEKAQDL